MNNDYNEFEDYYYSYNYSYYDTKNLGEHYDLFRIKLKEIFNKVDKGYNCSIEGEHFENEESEYNYITRLQFESRLISNKYNNEDDELLYYKKLYERHLIIKNDLIEVIYWSNEFRKFIYFAKLNNLLKMVDLFNFNYKCLGKSFNYIMVDKIINVFKNWCDDNNLDKESKDESLFPNDSDIEDVVNEFFNF